MRKGRVGFHMAFSALCVGQWNYKSGSVQLGERSY